MTVDRPAPTPPPARRTAAAPPNPPLGLAGLRTYLDRVVQRHRLRSLVVVIDDADLGRQAFRAGPGAVESGVVAAGPGVTTDPPLAPGDLDDDMLMALCAMSLHLQLLGEVDDVDDDHELALRRLPGVYAVALEHDGDVTLCHVLATADAPEDVARRAVEALSASTGAKVVVEVHRDPPEAADNTPAPARPVITPEIEAQFADATWSPDAAAWRTTRAPVEHRGADTSGEPEPVPNPPALRPEPTTPTLRSVRSVPETGEIEAHLAVGGVRAVGRASLAHGLAGAVEAVLTGTRELDPAASGWMPTWVRTVETTADGRFVVAVSLAGPNDAQRHGIASGASPIEGAARATTLALADAPTSGSDASPGPRPAG